MPLDTEQIQKLVEQALAARTYSHSPYSHFAVGAALITDSGRIFTGCNVENASYGLTICAEVTAMSKCVSEGGGKPVAIAVSSISEKPIPPCGRCRQFLLEFNPQMEIFCATNTGEYRRFILRELLPFDFSVADLEQSNRLQG